GTTKADVRRCLDNWKRGDNGILNLSRAFRLEPGTAWQINPRILHAPGSRVTYEPQVNSDVFAMFQSEVDGRIVPWELLTKDVPKEHHHDLDYLVDMLDWDANVNPEFAKSNRVFPCPVRPFAETEDAGYREQWVCYGTGYYSAKELTVLPKRSASIKDAAAYGLIVVQGHGTFETLGVSAPTMIRYGEMTEDELFVTVDAAVSGVRVENKSDTDPLVILKHFGPGNPDAEPLRRRRSYQPATIASRWITKHSHPAISTARRRGRVGKGSPRVEPTIEHDPMPDWTSKPSFEGGKFAAVDLFLFKPH